MRTWLPLVLIIPPAFVAATQDTSGCHFTTPAAIVCDDPKNAAMAFVNLGFDAETSSRSHIVQLLRESHCLRANEQYKTAVIKQLSEGRVATPEGWVTVVTAQVNNGFYWFAKDYIAGKCEKYVPSNTVLDLPIIPEGAPRRSPRQASENGSKIPAVTPERTSRMPDNAFLGTRKEVERVQSVDQFTRSFNGGFGYILEDRYSTSSEIIQVNLTTGAKRDVIDGHFVQVIRTGKYAGWLLTSRHRYYDQGGSYECGFVVRPDGKAMFQVDSDQAKADIGIANLISTLDPDEAQCGATTPEPSRL